jgi:serine/threonine protein kinase/tetratricopeptide (TPR) repeat protein
VTVKCPKCNTKNPDDSKYCKECGALLKPSEDISVTKTLQTPAGEFSKDTIFAMKYRIIEELGEGGMGVVYKAKDMRLDRTVALKFLPPELTKDEEAKKRFIQEAKAAAALDHPNICTVYEVDEADDQTFIAMGYIEGKSLKNKLESGPLDIDEAKDIAIQVAEGLKEAHEKGIVHRDIKPANIMITKKGQAKITDFGLAKLSWGVDLTKPSTIMGTVGYMSPEQAKGETVDHRTDIWSLGAMMYEMLVGERPFKKDPEQALIYAILNDKPTPLSLLRPDIPAHIEHVIERALAKNAVERYQDIGELISNLKESLPITFAKAEKSIVVLPFDDLSPDRDQEYFSDGLTEEVISDLSGIGALRVISRSSAMTFKGTKKTAPEIAKQLNVQYVLEGSVRKAGTNLRITAQLIDATKDTHLWAEKYSGTLDDVFDIQEKVSRSIVRTLKIKLTNKKDKQIASRPIENVHAYECHLRAIYQIWLTTEEGLEQALKFIDNGLEIIGKNEVLYADKGQVYMHYVDFVVGKDESCLKKAEQCVKEIFALNPDSAYGNFLNGLMLRNRGNAQAAVKVFKKAIQAFPEDSNFLTWLAWVYSHWGKCEAARSLSRKIIELDPLSPKSHMLEGTIDLFEGKFGSSIKYLYKFHQIEPGNPFYRYWYAKALAYNQNIEEALKIFELIERDTPNTIWSQLSVFFTNALKEKKTEALQSVTKEAKEMFKKDEMFPIWMAESYILIHEIEEALDWLEHGVNWGFINYPFLKQYDTFLENIRDEPRFKKLMERVKHEWENFEL